MGEAEQKKLRDTQYALAGRHSLARSGPISAPAMNDDRPPQQGVIQRPSYGQSYGQSNGPGYVPGYGQGPPPRTLRELFRL